MARLSKEQIESAFRELGTAAKEKQTSVRLLLLGGAAMALGFKSRESTRDVDAVVLAPADRALVRKFADAVAAKLGLPGDWLNDAAKGYVRPPVRETVLFEAPGITVVRPAIEQLAAMKLSAWRDDLDIADAERLLAELKRQGMSRAGAWEAIQPYLAPGAELKAKYAFEDLWGQS